MFAHLPTAAEGPPRFALLVLVLLLTAQLSGPEAASAPLQRTGRLRPDAAVHRCRPPSLDRLARPSQGRRVHPDHFTEEAAKGNFETDSFTASTPAGLLAMKNFIVRYPAKKTASSSSLTHYETNYPLRDIDFVGANDGGATTALLIELGNVLPRASARRLQRLAGLRRRRRGHPVVERIGDSSTARAISQRSGRRTAPSRRSKHSSSPT